MRYLDNGFWVITEALAKRIARTLPAHGRERLVEHGGAHYWLCRTIVNGRRKWALRETSWKLVNGQASL